MRDDVEPFLPLSPATLHVLLALTGGELHGYGIMLEVARQSGGQYRIGPGTLYDNLKKLLGVGLVLESPADGSAMAVAGDAPARRRYRLSQVGGAVLAAETERLAGVVREARRCLKKLDEGVSL